MMRDDGDGERQRRIARTWAAVWRCQYRVQHGDRSVLAALGRYAARLRALTGEQWYMEQLFDMVHDGPEHAAEHQDPAMYAALAAVDEILARETTMPPDPDQPQPVHWLRVRFD